MLLTSALHTPLCGLLILYKLQHYYHLLTSGKPTIVLALSSSIAENMHSKTVKVEVLVFHATMLGCHEQFAQA